MTPWVTPIVQANPPGAPPFNSATAVTPWVTPWNRTSRSAADQAFNSATAVTPWVTSGRAALAARAASTFNSATAVTPWVTRWLRGMQDHQQSSFNSATAVTPWVTVAGGGGQVLFRHGLQFGHGGDAVGDHYRIASLRQYISLQFGHGGDAVGDDATATTAITRSRPSIRPRR